MRHIGPAVETDAGGAAVFSLEVSVIHPPVRPGFSEVRDRIARLEADPRRAEGLARARERLAETIHEAGTLAALRLSKGLSQTALATKAGTSQSRLSRIESGLDDPQLSTVAKIAQALDMDVAVVADALLRGKK